MKSLASDEICALAHEAGFHKSRVISARTVLEILDRKQDPFLNKALLHIINSNFKNLCLPFKDCSLLVCALSCHRQEPDDLSTADDPHVLIAPFARQNYYAIAVRKMKTIAREVRERTGVPKQALRIFCNSRIPEKLFAALSGLGFYGKNSLLISPGLGSRHIITLLLLPIYIDSQKRPPLPLAPGLRCGNCTACIQACPTQALHIPGKVDTKLCLQDISTQLIILPERIKKKWGYRLYGCESCQIVCPYNSWLSQTTKTDGRAIGPSLSIATLLQLSYAEWKNYFKRTPMGLSWINPYSLIRNTLLAAGNRKNKVLNPDLRPYTKHGNKVLRDAAQWALDMINT